MVTNVKMQVTPDLSERVQEIVFANGCGWLYGVTKEVNNLNANFLFIDSDRYLYSGNTDNICSSHEYYEEISAYDFIASQGEQKWLPRFGETVEVRCNDEWVKAVFYSYRPKATFPFTLQNNKWQFFVASTCRPLKTTKTITIDGKDIEISQESFEALKAQLV